MFYIGEVRDNRDPSGTGRIKVRFYNKHNDIREIPDAGLPWAHPILPITSMTSGGIGHKPRAPMIGARVICVYLENDSDKLYPYYIGCIIRAEKDDNTGIQQEDKKSGIKKINSSSAAPDSPGGKIS